MLPQFLMAVLLPVPPSSRVCNFASLPCSAVLGPGPLVLPEKRPVESLRAGLRLCPHSALYPPEGIHRPIVQHARPVVEDVYI